MKKWNGDTSSTEIGKIRKCGKQDAVNGDSRNKAAYIYIREVNAGVASCFQNIMKSDEDFKVL